MSDPVPAQVRLERIYLKDASWESPRSPGVFDDDWKPEVKVDLNTRSNRLDETRFEIVLTLTLKARLAEDVTAFVAEVQQAGVFHLEGVEGEPLRHILATFCPNTLFPYAREALDNLAMRGGFPPPTLAPVNFEVIYAEALRRQEASQTTH